MKRLLLLIISLAMAQAVYAGPPASPPLDVDGSISTHAADTTAVHGVTDTSALLDATHTADTTAVHGVTDTSALLDATHTADTSLVHGITDTTKLAESGSTDVLQITGTLSGKVGVVTTAAATYTLGTGTANEAYGYLLTATATSTITLPAVAIGMSVCVYSTTAAAVHVDPNGSDRIILDGVALGDGDKLTSASGAGDFICVVGESAAGWLTLGRSGTWIDGS